MKLSLRDMDRAHQTIGSRLGEMIYAAHPGGVADSYIQLVEGAVSENITAFVRDHGGTSDDAVNARLVVGAVARVRYSALCATATASKSLRELCAPLAASQGGAGRPAGRSVPPQNRNRQRNG